MDMEHGAAASFRKVEASVNLQADFKATEFNIPFILETDASDEALGAVLCQLDDQKQEHPVAYISRKLTDQERKYCTREKEALAIVWATDKLRYYLWGKHFTVITDHSSLQWLLDV